MDDIDLSQVQSTVEEVVGTETVETAKDFLKQMGELLSLPLIKLIITLLLCVLVAKILLRVINRTLDRMKLESTTCKFLRSVVRVLVWIAVLLVGAGTLGFEITSLVALVSVCGAAVALAAQNALANFFGGIQLLGTKPFLAGDYISCSAGEGTVVEVGLINTELKTLDNRIVIIPNGTISTANITNYSRGGTRRLELDFAVSYKAPIDKVREVMLEVISNHPLSLSEPEAPFARITAYGESSVTYTARVWCLGSNYWALRFDLLENMKKAFDANGIEIPYNHLNVHMIEKKAQ